MICPLYLVESRRPKVYCPAGSWPGVGLSHRANKFASKAELSTMFEKGVAAPVDDKLSKPKPYRGFWFLA